MDYKRLFLTLGAQAGLFTAGVLAFLAFTHGFYATTLLCLLIGISLTFLGPTYTLVRSDGELVSRSSATGAIYTAELSRRRLQVLLDQAPSSLLLRSADGQIIAVNRAARKLFNVAYALPVATKRKLLGDTGNFGSQITWQGATYALERTQIDGRDDKSELVVMTDISADVRAAEATALRDLLRVLNHELMNALTPVASMSRSALDILKENGPRAKTEATNALERVVARTEGLTQFVNAYRELTRLPPPLLRPVVLAPWLDLVRESFDAVWREKGVELDVRAPANLHAEIDEDQMWLCVGNLLNNGAEAALERPDPRVRLDIDAAQDRLAFRVQDSGAGITPEQEAQVFLPFYTTKAGGNGVGLSLARQIVRAHGGQLRLVFERTEDALNGACFTFEVAASVVPRRNKAKLAPEHWHEDDGRT